MFRGLKVKTSLSLGHNLIQKRPDDRFLIAHPRSGSTWLRTILVNILHTGANSNPDIFNAQIPGVSIRNALRRINRLPSPRLVSSHTWYRSDIPAALYLVRDGRDTLISFYHYSITRKNGTENFAEFFELYCQGKYGHFWPYHVESWLDSGRKTMGDKLMVIRFEDMKADTTAVITDITRFLAIPATPETIEVAIENSSIKNMRKIEQSRRGKTVQTNASFYRGGKSGQWQDYFTPSIEQKFYEVASDAMRLAGYDV